MASGITLKPSQKFWGSGVDHAIQTSVATISIPAQSSSAPTITNTDIHTEMNAITLASNNAISGFTITSAKNDAIHSDEIDLQSLDVSFCTIENSTTFAINATALGNATISLTNNQILNNYAGAILHLNGTSTVACLDNTFQGTSSTFNFPLEISADNNVLTANIENNIFDDNNPGSIFVDLINVLEANINVLNNKMTNNKAGTRASLGSNIVIEPTGTTDLCSIVLSGNTFSGNEERSLFVDSSGAFTTFELTASSNTMSDNGSAAIDFNSSATSLTLNATNNTITNLVADGGIVFEGATSISTANITINNNIFTNLGDDLHLSGQNAINIGQSCSALNLTMQNNTISTCNGSGITCYASEFTNMTANITGNAISNCLNDGPNSASGISLETYVNLTATVANNTFTDNASPDVAFNYYSNGTPTVCLTLTGNISDTDLSDNSYDLTNPAGGAFNVIPLDAVEQNTGTINLTGDVIYVGSCP
jgi:hypothetical protein